VLKNVQKSLAIQKQTNKKKFSKLSSKKGTFVSKHIGIAMVYWTITVGGTATSVFESSTSTVLKTFFYLFVFVLLMIFV
jgi:ABC-type transporter Mla maintaining outer membrane lipid asymmetry permease subunit MlaE